VTAGQIQSDAAVRHQYGARDRPDANTVRYYAPIFASPNSVCRISQAGARPCGTLHADRQRLVLAAQALKTLRQLHIILPTLEAHRTSLPGSGNAGSVALLSRARIFRFCRVVDQTARFPGTAWHCSIGRAIPASAENWSANDIVSALSIAIWPLRIMWISAIPASPEPADRNDLKLRSGLVTRLMVRWSCPTMLLRYLTWCA